MEENKLLLLFGEYCMQTGRGTVLKVYSSGKTLSGNYQNKDDDLKLNVLGYIDQPRLKFFMEKIAANDIRKEAELRLNPVFDGSGLELFVNSNDEEIRIQEEEISDIEKLSFYKHIRLMEDYASLQTDKEREEMWKYVFSDQ